MFKRFIKRIFNLEFKRKAVVIEFNTKVFEKQKLILGGNK